MGRKLTCAQINEDLSLEGRNIRLVGEYINIRTKVEFTCLECGHYWYAIPFKVRTNKTGCPNCAGTLRLTPDKINKELARTSRKLLLEGDYINARTPVTFRCLACDYTWATTTSNVRQGTGCPVCSLSGWDKRLVYIMSSSIGTKVGVSTSPQKRLKQVASSGNLHDLTLFGEYTPHEGGSQMTPLEVEQLTHRQLARDNCHLSGFDGATEFFTTSPSDVEKFLISIGLRKIT